MEALWVNAVNHSCAPWQTGPLSPDRGRGLFLPFGGNTDLILYLSKGITKQDSMNIMNSF